MKRATATVLLLLAFPLSGCLAATNLWDSPPAPSDYTDQWALEERLTGTGMTFHRRHIVPEYLGLEVKGLLRVEISPQRTASEFVFAVLYLEVNGNATVPLQFAGNVSNTLSPRLFAHRDGAAVADPMPLPLLESFNDPHTSGDRFTRQVRFSPLETYALVLGVAHVASTPDTAPLVELEIELDQPRLAPKSNVTFEPDAAGILSLREGRGLEGSETTLDTGYAGLSRADRATASFQMKRGTFFISVLFVLNATVPNDQLRRYYAGAGTAEMRISNGIKSWDFAVGADKPHNSAVFGRYERLTDPWTFEVSGTGSIEFLVWYADLPAFWAPQN